MTETTSVPVLLTTGLDLGDRTTHRCTLDADRQVVERSKLPTTREALVREFGDIARRRIVIEAGSQSLWVSHLLRELGHEVMVVDPRRVQKLVAGNRKTDRRDAESLARLAMGVPELLGAAHHRTFETQADLSMLRSRDILGFTTCAAANRPPSAMTASLTTPPAIITTVVVMLTIIVTTTIIIVIMIRSIGF